MKKIKQGKTLVGLRPTEDDMQLLIRLMKKLGVGESQIIRLGLRALATKEGVAA
jgi:hypothetical protein